MSQVEKVVRCLICKEDKAVKVDEEGYAQWQYYGKKIQQALRKNTAGERELLVSKVCEKCFDRKFGEEP